MKWQTAVLEIREKINAAIQDMPPVDEISQLLSGTCMYDEVSFDLYDTYFLYCHDSKVCICCWLHVSSCFAIKHLHSAITLTI